MKNSTDQGGCYPQRHSRHQSPRSFWSAPRIATSGQVQHRKSAIHGLPVTLRMLRAKTAKSDWFWSQSIVFTKPFKTGMSLNQAKGRNSWCGPKGAPPLETRMSTEAESRDGLRPPKSAEFFLSFGCRIQLLLYYSFNIFPVLNGVSSFRSLFCCSPKVTQPRPQVFSVKGSIICSELLFDVNLTSSLQ